eukprot:TRINITY_DN8062_c0_g1_i1.p1 TRINITY_DN8062_c0_g1~~TRINITY_DN8062_c0_g1_i1.p1  ORF type:complete len:733 (-),score=152.88 TRINITY_DN8062_c0_g1_i1:37-2199(-)
MPAAPAKRRRLSASAKKPRVEDTDATPAAEEPVAQAIEEVNPFFGGPVATLDVDPKIKTALQKAGVERLTTIQAQAFGPMMQPKQDVLIKSETGSGKTIAYALPIVQRLLNTHAEKRISRSDGMHCVVLVPTRELTVQTEQTFLRLAQPFPFIVPGAITGGQDRKGEKTRLRKGLTIVVATPGRLYDHLSSTQAFVVENLSTIVYDEADRLLDCGFEKVIKQILEQLHSRNVSLQKSVLASATLDDKVQRLAMLTLQSPVLVTSKATHNEVSAGLAAQGEHFGKEDAPDEITVPTTLRQHYILTECKHRLATLAAFLRWKMDSGQANKMVIFFNSCDSVEFHYALFSRARIRDAQDEQWTRQQQEIVREARKERKKARVVAKRTMRKVADRREDSDDDASNYESDAESGSEPEEVAGEANDAMLSADYLEGQAHGSPMFTTDLFKLHGNVAPYDRLATFTKFRKAERGILMCTDVAARGVDLPNVDWIVQYDTPGEERTYVHRVGRTARIGRAGDALLFLMPHEREYVTLLQDTYHMTLRRLNADVVLFHLAQLMNCRAVLEAANCLQLGLQNTVGKSASLRRLSALGFQAFVRAYRTHPKRLLHVFDSSQLLLGHLARSFGVSEPPSRIPPALVDKVREKALAKVEAASGKAKKKVTEPKPKAEQKGTKRKQGDEEEEEGPKYRASLALKAEKRVKDRTKDLPKRHAPLNLRPTSEFDA